MGYAGLFNSSYQPSPLELIFINTPQNQLGPVVTGEIFITLLQGVLLVQYFEYLCHYRNEKRWTKWLVHITFLLCLVKFAYIWWFTWDRFVPHFGDWAYLTEFSPISVPIGISTTIPSAACQMFFIHRCWALSRNWFFLIPAVGTLVLTVGSGIALTWASALAAGGNVAVTKMILTSVNISLASGLACDLFITTFTCFYLVREKTGFRETDGLISRLIKCSIESAAGPTIVALINLILSNKAVNNQWFLVMNIPLSHVYGCSLLYSVNARRAVAMRNTLSTSKPKTGANTTAMIASVHRSKSTRKHDNYPLRDLTDVANSGVFVEVQTVMHQDEVILNRMPSALGKQTSQETDSDGEGIAEGRKPEYFAV